jgi:hypothetical protein
MTRDELVEVGAWAYLEILLGGNATDEARMQQRDRDISRAVISAVEPIIREGIAQDIESKFGHLGPLHPYFEFAPLAARIARGTR